MIFDVHNFGDVLMSRPAGKEAFAMAKAYVIKSLDENESVSQFLKYVSAEKFSLKSLTQVTFLV
ncbi:hypothetical protein [Treponema sp.]|uniref:hypothetical protein n=1 Tax=Treponema sp. TaxID=166 RepID=UPI00298E3BDB|nr:hypothetical protein [Treponema sp.]MCR5613979.1 hypothetical protein [Treponema sp.]